MSVDAVKTRNKKDRTSKLKEKELSEKCSRILSSIETISRVVSCGEKIGEKFKVYDPPYVLEMDRDKMVLKEETKNSERVSEDVAILTPEGIVFYRSDEDLKVLECWCTALTSMSFKRFVVKQPKR